MYARFPESRRRPTSELLAGCLGLVAAACTRTHTFTTAHGDVTYQQKGKDAGTVTVTGKDGKIAAFCKTELARNGWKTESIVVTGQLNMLGANKERKQLMVQIADSGDKRSIMQIVSDKE
jgi:hypothetical protein